MIQAMNESTSIMDFQVKYKRINRTSYGMTGTVELKTLVGLEVISLYSYIKWKHK